MQPDEVQQLVEHEYAQTSIRVKARQLSRRKDFRDSSREDIEQDLWLHLLTHAAKFDGDRSSLNTFIDRMVNSGAAILVRSREREMRADGFHAQSLDANRSGGDSSQRSLRSTLSSTDGARRIGNTRSAVPSTKRLASPTAQPRRRLPNGLRSKASRC